MVEVPEHTVVEAAALRGRWRELELESPFCREANGLEREVTCQGQERMPLFILGFQLQIRRPEQGLDGGW